MDKDAQRVYALIWARAVSSQMSNAVMRQVGGGASDAVPHMRGGGLRLHASASSIEFEGFLATRQVGTGGGISVLAEHTETR